MSTLTLNGLLVLKSAINHVPPTYSMRRKDFQGFSLRSVIIHEIMATCASECCLTLSDVYFYVSFLERHCPKFISTSEFLPKDKLWKLCDGCRYRYAKFLSPPLQCCLNCSEGVTMHNPPSKPTRYSRLKARFLHLKSLWSVKIAVLAMELADMLIKRDSNITRSQLQLI